MIVNGNDYNTHDGTCVRDYIHVQDLAIAHVKALDYLLGNSGNYTFNVGTGYGLSVLDIIKSFENATNIKLKYTIGPRRKGDIEKIFSNGDLIKKILLWEPVKTTREAMLSSWKWQINKLSNYH